MRPFLLRSICLAFFLVRTRPSLYAGERTAIITEPVYSCAIRNEARNRFVTMATYNNRMAWQAFDGSKSVFDPDNIQHYLSTRWTMAHPYVELNKHDIDVFLKFPFHASSNFIFLNDTVCLYKMRLLPINNRSQVFLVVYDMAQRRELLRLDNNSRYNYF